MSVANVNQKFSSVTLMRIRTINKLNADIETGFHMNSDRKSDESAFTKQLNYSLILENDIDVYIY